MQQLRPVQLFLGIFFSIIISVQCLAETPEKGKVTGAKVTQFPDWFKESFLDITEDIAEANESGKHVILFMHLNGCPD